LDENRFIFDNEEEEKYDELDNSFGLEENN
jgi:hypothetical protein